MKIYWYEVYKLPQMSFQWMRSFENGKMYVGFDGALNPHEVNRCSGVEMGHMTVEEFENKHGTFMTRRRF